MDFENLGTGGGESCETKRVDLGTDFFRAIGYGGVQGPYEGLSQLVNHVAGAEFLPTRQFIQSPTEVGIYTTDWYTQQVGLSLGMLLPFMGVKGGVRTIGKTIGTVAEVSFAPAVANFARQARAPLSILEAGATGFAYDFALTPVNKTESNFWSARTRQGFVGAATFGSFDAAALAQKKASYAALSETRPWLIHNTSTELRQSLVAGSVAGMINAQTNVLLNSGELAGLEETLGGAFSFTVVGLGLKALGVAGRKIRGQETVADLVSRDPSLRSLVSESDVAKKLVADFGSSCFRFNDGPRLDVAGFSSEPIINIATSLNGKPNSAKTASIAAELIDGLARIEARTEIPFTRDVIKDAQSFMQFQKNRESHALLRQASFVSDMKGQSCFPELFDNWKSRWLATEGSGGRNDASAFGRYYGRTTDGSFGFLRAGDAPNPRIELKDSAIGESNEPLKSVLEFDVKTDSPEMLVKFLNDMADPVKSAAVLPFVKPGDVVVDIGAGGGEVAASLSLNVPGANVIALDLSPSTVESLISRRSAAIGDRASGDKTVPTHSILEADAITAPLPPESVDVIHTSSNVHEVYSFGNTKFGSFSYAAVDGAMASWNRALKPGGRLIIHDFVKPDPGPDWTMRFDSQAGRQYFELFVKGKPGFSTPEHGEFPPVKFKGRQLRFTENPDGSVTMPSADAFEFLVSARWGMDSPADHISVTNEQFSNFDHQGFIDVVKRNAPAGYRMNVLLDRRDATPSYVNRINEIAKVYVPADTTAGTSELVPMAEFPAIKQVLVVQKVKTH